MARYRIPTDLPVVQAPMAGGPSTPELAIAAANAGGLGFIAGGYLTGSTLRAAIDAVRAETSAPLGVNLFVPSVPAPRERVDAYAATLHHEAERLGAQLGAARWDADAFDEKIDALMKATPHLVTFTFGTPDSDAVDRLHRGGAQIGVTVTATGEARLAAEAGADVLIVQGTEAGGHQGTFTGEAANETPLLDALQQIHDVALPMIATGGIVTAADAKAAMDAGAIGVQIGTALLCTPEAATTALHRRALLGKMFADTVVTRAYSGRYARGLRNRFAREHLDAPNAYPEIHYLTRPLRQAATAAGDADVPNFWAGANWGSIREASAAEVIRSLATGL